MRRFIHISTPAVLSRFEHQFELREDHALPDEHTSLYGETKAAAETIVSDSKDLETAIVRPKAIYGPGDTALLPRLVEASRSGRLRVIGDGSTITHLTHVDDVVSALILMAEAESVSGIYHIAGPEPVKLWEMISELLPRLGIAAPQGTLTLERAMRIANASETLWSTVKLGGEPPLTRYKVAMLAFSQTLDTSRARRELGFEAKISPEEGFESVRETWGGESRSTGTAPKVSLAKTQSSVDFTLVNTGTVHPSGLAVGEKTIGRTPIPVLAVAMRHEQAGLIIYDTGYGDLSDRMPGLFGYLYRWLLKPRSAPLADTLVQSGMHAEGVSWVVISHFDPDHVGGLHELPNAGVIADIAAWTELNSRRARIWRRMARLAIPSDLAARVRLVDTADGPVDVFGGGSIIALGMPGHAPGHLGLIVTDRDRTRYLLCGDAVLRSSDVRAGRLGPYKWAADDRQNAKLTLEKLAAMADQHQALLVPSHCPEIANRLLADAPRSNSSHRSRQ